MSEEVEFKIHHPFTEDELKKAIKNIGLDSADVFWCYCDAFDPYGLGRCKAGQTGREYFVRSPAEGLWIWFDDLPNDLRNALWKKFEKKLAFPAGLDVEEELPHEFGKSSQL